MSPSAPSYQQFANVKLGKNVTIQDWAVIGLPPPGTQPGDLETIIEDDAVIRSHTVIYAGSRIGCRFQTGHRVVLGPGLDIGAGCSVGTGSVLMGFAQMENQAKVHGHATIGEFSLLQGQSWVGPRCVLNSTLNQRCIIAAGAILGASVYVAPGIRVGEKVLVASSTCLLKDATPYRLVAGNPPRGILNVTRLQCPYKLIDRPYEPDSPEIQALVREKHKNRPSSEIVPPAWQQDLWHALGATSQIL